MVMLLSKGLLSSMHKSESYDTGTLKKNNYLYNAESTGRRQGALLKSVSLIQNSRWILRS